MEWRMKADARHNGLPRQCFVAGIQRTGLKLTVFVPFNNQKSPAKWQGFFYNRNPDLRK
jgi:hypothetical protein